MFAMRAIACVSWASCVVLLGCGPSNPNARPTAPVTVTVTYNGNPVEGATVTFISDEQPVVTAVGRTDAQGTVKLSTYGEADGAVIGSHRVTVIKSVIANEQPQADIDSPDYEPLGPGGAPVPVLKSQIPTRYASPGNSGLTANVTSDTNEITFPLTD